MNTLFDNTPFLWILLCVAALFVILTGMYWHWKRTQHQHLTAPTNQYEDDWEHPNHESVLHQHQDPTPTPYVNASNPNNMNPFAQSQVDVQPMGDGNDDGGLALLDIQTKIQNFDALHQSQPNNPQEVIRSNAGGPRFQITQVQAGVDYSHLQTEQPTATTQTFKTTTAATTPLAKIDSALNLDGLIDVVVPIGLAFPTTGEALLAVMPQKQRIGHQLFRIEGVKENGGSWESIRNGQKYVTLQAGVQMANRKGALTALEYSEFIALMTQFSDAISGTPDFPDMQEQIHRAKELDGFAAAHDAQLRLVLRAQQAPWGVNFITQQATALGFVPSSVAGRWVLRHRIAGLPPLVTLSFNIATPIEDTKDLQEVRLILDVPHVPQNDKPYPKMRHAAEVLAKALDAHIINAHGELMNTASLDRMEADLATLYQGLNGFELTAGSSLARRLFS